MPCNDDCRIPLAEAALCAIMKVLVERDQMRSIALDVNWQAAGLAVSGDGTTLSWTLSTTGTVGYYRIQVSEAP